MAYTVTNSSELKLTCNFDDGDTRILTIDNPKSDLDSTTILNLQASMITTQPIIGDKTGAAFTNFSSAKIINKIKYNFTF